MGLSGLHRDVEALGDGLGAIPLGVKREGSLLARRQLLDRIRIERGVDEGGRERRRSVKAAPQHGADGVVQLLHVVPLENESVEARPARPGIEIQLAMPGQDTDLGSRAREADIVRRGEAVQSGHVNFQEN